MKGTYLGEFEEIVLLTIGVLQDDERVPDPADDFGASQSASED